MNHVLAIDQGTTSTRVLVIDGAMHVRAAAQRALTQHYPRPGWVEHDAEEIWQTTLACIQEALAAGQLTHREIAAIGITNQRETTILWDRETAQPVAPAIVWQDRRTADLCDDLRQRGLSQHVQQTTGLVIDAYFCATKIRWLLDHLPHLQQRCLRGEIAFGTVDAWLLYRLTGGRVHATDVTNASRTMLFDLHAMQWDDELLELLQIPRQILPDVRPSSGILGTTTLFGGEIPIAGMAGDQHAALFGQACHEPGMAKNTYGTGSFLLMHTGRQVVQSNRKLLTTLAWQIAEEPPEYALEGSIFVTGAAVQWLRDGLGLIASADETEALARSVDSTDDVYFVPALTGLGAPYWDPHARGAIVGLTRGTTRAQLVRATLESIAYSTRDVLDAMAADAGPPLRELRADGGASANGFLMQFQADILGVPVLVPQNPETTALGAAFLAGLATGVWKSREEIATTWQPARRYTPREINRDALYARWQKAVERARDWAE